MVARDVDRRMDWKPSMGKLLEQNTSHFLEQNTSHVRDLLAMIMICSVVDFIAMSGAKLRFRNFGII